MADISLVAVTKDIEMDQGSSIEIPFAVTRSSVVLNLTGYTLRAQVRSSYAAAGSPLINLTQANGKIAFVSASLGTFKIVLAPSDTINLQFTKDSPDVINAVYDIELISPTSVVYKASKGAFDIYREATR